MADPVDTLMIDVRASTAGFAADVTQMRASFDSILVDGLGRAGQVLERGLLSALRRGSLGFEDLRRIALSVIGEITGAALQIAIGGGGGQGGGQHGGLFNLSSLVGAIIGQPGRATGGLVSEGRGYLVGERGPELFVPHAAGRIEPAGTSRQPREVRVAIHVVAPRGSTAPESLQRSSRQVARAVRRALTEY